MAAVDFPDSPIDNQIFQAGNTKYKYNATKGTWDVAQVIGATSIDDLSDINLTVQPESITLNVDSPSAGHAPTWLWTWEQSTLPFSRIAITNSPQTSVPLYMQGSYVINNFANTVHGEMTQAHAFKLKWIEGAGDDNLIDWVTYSTATASHPDINGNSPLLVSRLIVNVPAAITLPTLTTPNVSYTVVPSETTSGYIFSGTASGTNIDIGPFYRGGTYTVNINAPGHPFYFTTDNGTSFEAGAYVGEWTDGVTGSRTDNGTITFTVPQGAPDVLYYQCGNHSPMRGAIRVKDLEVETNENGNYIIYGQHTQEDHVQPMEIRPLPELASQMCIVYDKTLNQWMPQDLATYVENTPSFENKIKEVAGTATLVAPDGTSLVASVEIYSTASYLPQIDNTNGDIAFVEDTQELKVWKAEGTGGAWLDIAAGGGSGGGGGAGSPTITSVTPPSYDGTDASTFSIVGTNFTLGTVVDFIDASGTAYRATTTTVTDQANLTAVTPQAFLESDGPLDVRVTTNTGATVTTTDAIQTGGSPVWTTPSGTLYQNAFGPDIADGSNSYRILSSLNETIAATDPEGQPVTYSITSGGLPPNGVLDPHTGIISGNLPSDIGGDTTYSFTASANDSSGNATPRTFNIIVKNQPGTIGWLWLSGNEHTHTLPAGNYLMLAIGAGGGGASGPGGAGGWVPTRINVTQQTEIKVGVGITSSGNSFGNISNYAMRAGSGGGSNTSTGGGGGSYVSVTNTSAVTDYHTVGSYNFIVVAGGGGGGANHGFTANYGGHGLGGGGGAYNSSYPNSSYGGNDGYNSNGNGGSAQSSGSNGGSANTLNLLRGGTGGSNSNGGGGGGGGAGGGGGGAGGSGSASGGVGGYLNTSAATILNARGGGGGGSHGGSCGGTGGGGGSLIYTSYRWDADSITYPANAQDQSLVSQGYYGKMNTYINNTANLAGIWSQISNRGTGGNNNSNGINGAVLIMTADMDMSSTPPTVIS